MIGGMENRDEKSNLLPKIDLYGNRNGIGKRMIECGRIEE